jgi:transglutaminase-like putative cysteine protease
MLAGVGLLWGLLAGAAPLQAPRGVSFAPPPAWVDPQVAPLDATAPAEGLSQGRHYLLADEQVRVSGHTVTDYQHLATRAVNERGVEDVANVQIRFDPSYQTLTIHRIEVLRAGKAVSRVSPDAVKLLQREASLESLIFDGRLTAHVALQDVRVGDVVETVYSVQGQNPVFGAHRFGSFDLEWGMPVAYRHARLLWPQGRPLYWKLHNGAQAATVTEAGGELDHRWRLRHVPARLTDSDSPGWYDPYAWAEWGEFADWPAVARWALPLYQLPAGALPAVDREVARIAAATQDPEQRLLAALRFVQREVRYLGIEMGANSHAPHTPELVLQRRFGDCKDKTLLSLALLRGLGIPARAALVHTGLRQAAADRLPTPWAFNHVLVQADLGERRVWLDPTRTPQAGKGVAQWVQADFGRALLVDAGTREFVPMAGAEARLLRRDMRTVLDASAGFDKPATFTVTTQAYGESAEQLRNALATTSREDLQKQYLDFYAASYTGLAVDQPFTVRDDTDANQVELVEHYRRPAYWVRDDKRERWVGELEVPDLQEWLRRPKGLNRQGPLALRHPVDFRLVSEFRLPQRWQLKPDPLLVEDAAFVLRREEAWPDARTLVLTDRYQSRSDHVAAADTARYVAQLDKARTGINYNLYHQDGADTATVAGGDSPHWVPVMAGLIGLGALIWLVRRLARWDPQPWPHGAPVETAIGGWLYLPVIGLLASLVRVGNALVESAPALTVQTWTALTRPGSPAYHPLWAPTLIVESLLNLAIAVGAVLLLWLMLNRRSSLPRLYIAWWVLVIVALLGDAAMHQPIPALAGDWTDKDSVELGRACLFGVIWISYFLRSDRVRRTFVCRRRAATAPLGAAESAGNPAT